MHTEKSTETGKSFRHEFHEFSSKLTEFVAAAFSSVFPQAS